VNKGVNMNKTALGPNPNVKTHIELCKEIMNLTIWAKGIRNLLPESDQKDLDKLLEGFKRKMRGH